MLQQSQQGHGSIASAIPQVDLDAMSKAAMQAMWRGAKFASGEILSSYFTPWRSNPIAIAIVNPWLYIRSAIQRGICTRQRLLDAWSTCHDQFVGPLSSLRQSLKLADISGSPDLLTCASLAESLDPLAVPTHQLRDFLLRSLRVKDMTSLAKRRPTMAPWASPFDHRATFRLLRSSTFSEPKS